MKFSWIDYYKTDIDGQPEFSIYGADEEVVMLIRSHLFKSAKESFERGKFTEARKLIEKIEEIDHKCKEAKATQKEATNG